MQVCTFRSSQVGGGGRPTRTRYAKTAPEELTSTSAYAHAYAPEELTHDRHGARVLEECHELASVVWIDEDRDGEHAAVHDELNVHASARRGSSPGYPISPGVVSAVYDVDLLETELAGRRGAEAIWLDDVADAVPGPRPMAKSVAVESFQEEETPPAAGTHAADPEPDEHDAPRVYV